MGAYFCQQGAVTRVSAHRVLMNFMHRDGWHISFLEEDCRTTLPLHLTFAFSDKIVEMHARWGAYRTLAERAAVEHGIEIGRGGVWLKLTTEEYRRLKMKR